MAMTTGTHMTTMRHLLSIHVVLMTIIGTELWKHPGAHHNYPATLLKLYAMVTRTSTRGHVSTNSIFILSISQIYGVLECFS